jgi:uncharacterized membrane protein
MKVKDAVTVNGTPEELYSFWRNFANFPLFMRHLESVQVRDDGRSHWKAKAPAGKDVEWDAEVVEEKPGQLIAWRSLPGADVDNSGVVRFQAAPGDRGTIVQVELQYDAPGGPLAVLIAKAFSEEPSQQVYDDLRAFKQIIEVGEVTISEGALSGNRLVQHPGQPPKKDEPVPQAAKA